MYVVYLACVYAHIVQQGGAPGHVIGSRNIKDRRCGGVRLLTAKPDPPFLCHPAEGRSPHPVLIDAYVKAFGSVASASRGCAPKDYVRACGGCHVFQTIGSPSFGYRNNTLQREGFHTLHSREGVVQGYRSRLTIHV